MCSFLLYIMIQKAFLLPLLTPLIGNAGVCNNTVCQASAFYARINKINSNQIKSKSSHHAHMLLSVGYNK